MASAQLVFRSTAYAVRLDDFMELLGGLLH